MRLQRWMQRVLPEDWHKRLSALLIGLFLLQYVFWIQQEEGVWLPETVLIVKLTLLSTAVTEALLRNQNGLRWCLQLGALVCATGFVVEYVPVRRDVDRLLDAFELLRDNFMTLSPFIWFALSAWIVTLLAITLLRSKKYIISALVVTVAAFAIRDSFSTLTLWKPAAAAIVCGLFLLTVRHFAELKQKHPTGWPHLVKYSPFIAMSVTVFVTAVVSLGALAPDVRPLLTDPYTLWKSMRGEGVAHSTNGAPAISLLGTASVSGYSRDDSSLGGSISFDETPVLQAVTSHRTYWRGETRALYTGDGWVASDAERRVARTAVPRDLPLPGSPSDNTSSSLRTLEVTQTITMLAGSNRDYPVLFGAYEIDKVQHVTVNGAETAFSSLRWLPGLSEVQWFADDVGAYPDSYTLVSRVPIIDEELLRSVADERPVEDDFEPYLDLPETLPSRVRELAQQVTASGVNRYDKAKLLEQYLSNTFAYTTEPDLSLGQSHDFVDRFLFEIREGYCDYFSTAMVVMARSIGIPARWVKGFAPGESNSDGEYIVRNSDAHSWVEAYFPGYGWIPFEPTAGFEQPTYLSDAGATEGFMPEPLPEPVPEEETGIPLDSSPELEPDTNEPTENNSVLPRPLIWALGAVWAALLLALGWGLRRILYGRRDMEADRHALLEFERFLRYAKRRGYTRKRHETARETLHRWFSPETRVEKEELESLLSLFERAKYGGNNGFSNEDRMTFFQKVQRLRQELQGK